MTDTTENSTDEVVRGAAGMPEPSAGQADEGATQDQLEEAMKDVVDPELGINVVDLGLVYDVHLDEGSNVVLDMTLTSAACPLTDVITDQTNSALEGLIDLLHPAIHPEVKVIKDMASAAVLVAGLGAVAVAVAVVVV